MTLDLMLIMVLVFSFNLMVPSRSQACSRDDKASSSGHPKPLGGQTSRFPVWTEVSFEGVSLPRMPGSRVEVWVTSWLVMGFMKVRALGGI